MNNKRRLVVGISGATGAIYGVRILEVLAKLGDKSPTLRRAWNEELRQKFELRHALAIGKPIPPGRIRITTDAEGIIRSLNNRGQVERATLIHRR